MSIVNAKGASGVSYTYTAFQLPVTWHDVPVNYMFASVSVGGWKVLYIGQADSAKNRLPCHERWDEAVKLGATHVLARVNTAGEEARKREEQDLILSHAPPLNVHHKPQNALSQGGAWEELFGSSPLARRKSLFGDR